MEQSVSPVCTRGARLDPEIVRSPLPTQRGRHGPALRRGDLQPANVMIGRMGEVVLMDWGVAKVAVKGDAGGRSSQQGQVIGTPAYMSPENNSPDAEPS
jgi:serine/threonine protein kinase